MPELRYTDDEGIHILKGRDMMLKNRHVQALVVGIVAAIIVIITSRLELNIFVSAFLIGLVVFLTGVIVTAFGKTK